MSTIGDRLDLLAAQLSRIEALVAAVVSPDAERKHIADSTATAEQIDVLSDAAPLQTERLTSILTTLDTRMTDDELRKELRAALFHTQQLGSIMQGTRTDIVEMRATMLRFSAVLEQVLRARVEDEEWHRTGMDRRSGERRKASGF